jgi:uncharacterized protein
MVVLQGTAFCNLNCSYCYLSEESRRNKATMATSTIRAIFDRIFESRFVGRALRVSWHSGEPLVLKPAYYREAVDTILEAATAGSTPDVDVTFDIQTNGTLVNRDWCDLLKAYEGRFALGISCDGPASLHDKYRRNWADKPTHHLTHAGMQLLAEHGIEFDVIAVVSLESLEKPHEFLDYFAGFRNHIREFHFNLHDEFFIEDENSPKIEAYAKKYDHFLQALLEMIGGSDGDRFPRIRNFSAFYNRLFEKRDRAQSFDARSMSRPLTTLSIETNGDVTTFYAGLTVDECRDLKNLYGDARGFVVGNLLEESLDDIARSPKIRRIARDFEASHAACESACDYFDLCSGGYSLIKYRRFGRFDATETPECRVHVKTFADALLRDMERSLQS